MGAFEITGGKRLAGEIEGEAVREAPMVLDVADVHVPAGIDLQIEVGTVPRRLEEEFDATVLAGGALWPRVDAADEAVLDPEVDE